MITEFGNGNYQEWVTLSTELIPAINNKINNELVPGIQNVILSMLGSDAEFSRDEANITEQYSGRRLTGVECTFKLTIPDFRVDTAPQEAIDTDQEAIKNALSNFGVSDVKIDVHSGELFIKASYNLRG